LPQLVPATLRAPSGHARFLTTPVVRRDIWDFYKSMLASFWTVEEVDVSKDHDDFQALSPDAQYCVKQVLAFFAVADGVVVSNLTENFVQEVGLIQARFVYLTQSFMEAIHSEMYSLLLETLIPRTDERNELIATATESAHITAKTDFALKYMNDRRPFAERLLAFAALEGIMFSSSFAVIYWLKTKGVMPGTCFSNELIARDEGMHRDFAIWLYNRDCEKLPSERVYDIVRESVAIEQRFVRECLRNGILGLNADLMCQYVEFVADHMLSNLDGVEKIFHRKNPLQYMELISLQGKTNFFEKRVGEYAKMNVAPSDADDKTKRELTFGDLDW